MTLSITATETWTATDALYLASKIGADLHLTRAYYGRPTALEIDDYKVEAAMLMRAQYLGTVEYGFKLRGIVVFSLKYSARFDGSLLADDRPGRVFTRIDLADAVWFSYLTYNDRWWRLSNLERERFEAQLPFKRSTAAEPARAIGNWAGSRTYSAKGNGVTRQIFCAK